LLLDAQDWMSDEELNLLWNEIERTATPDARVVFRTAGEASCIEGKLSPTLTHMWKRNDLISDTLNRQDRSAIYGGFHLYERMSG
jgi:S-adenosylmethionine-diacylglycerol 3-amino-3-carboxypropyl transferase